MQRVHVKRIQKCEENATRGNDEDIEEMRQENERNEETVNGEKDVYNESDDVCVKRKKMEEEEEGEEKEEKDRSKDIWEKGRDKRM